MGTTANAIAAGGGVRLQAVVAVEGYSSLITDGSTSAAVTAWAGTDWSSALPGLSLRWSNTRQEIRPWDPKVNVARLAFSVQPEPDNSDTFGIAVGKLSGGSETTLITAIDANDTTVAVKYADNFAATGEIHIHTECLGYSSRSTGADTFTIATRGKYAPFTRSGGGRMSYAHNLPSTDTPGVQLMPWVTSVPREWIGRWVGVWLHRVVAGVLDTKAEAHLAFAGKIVEVRDDENGLTWVECEDLRGALRDTVLMRDQFTAKVADGLFLQRGLSLVWKDISGTTVKTSNAFEVVASGASGANELDEGLYTYDEIVDALNDWLATEKAATRLYHDWTFRLTNTPDGLRTAIHVSPASTMIGASFSVTLATSPLMEFLGWGNVETITFAQAATERDYLSPEVPYRILMNSRQAQITGGPYFQVTDVRGTFFDNTDWMPNSLGLNEAESHALVKFSSGGFMVVRRESTTNFYPWLPNRVKRWLAELTGVDGVDLAPITAQRMDVEGEPLTITQVGVIVGPLNVVAMRLLASTGTSGHNHATHDVLPHQLGAALPWSLISSLPADFAALTAASDDIEIVVDKPTKLTDVLGADLLLRAAHFVWKSGLLRLTSWVQPTAASALHVLTEANKARPVGTAASERTVAALTDEYVRNVIKVEFGRRLGGDDYRDSRTVTDTSAMDAMGQRVVTIKARNTRKASTVENLISQLAGILPVFSRPMQILKRSVNLTMFEGVAPGDQCVITDEHVRDPSTGRRGITTKPGLIIAHARDFGGYETDTGRVADMSSEVEIVIFARDLIVTYAPAAEVDGYDAPTAALTVLDNAYSDSDFGIDIEHFNVGDMVKIIEIDPANPAAPLLWHRQIDSISGSDIVLDSALSSPAYDGTKTYRVIWDDWGTVTSAQRLKCYQADDATGLIDAGGDEQAAYEYGWQTGGARTWTEELWTSPIALYAEEAWGDGVGLDVGYEHDLIRIVNALVNTRTAPCLPTLGRNVLANSTGAAGLSKTIVAILPIAMGANDLGSQGDRYLFVAPWYRSSSGASATVTISLCAHAPVGTSRGFTSDADEYFLVGPYATQTWTTTSTTWAQGTIKEFSFRNLDGNGNGYLVIEVDLIAETRGPSYMRAGFYSEDGEV